jgi:hypothetical protein
MTTTEQAEWLSTAEAMAYIGVKRPESLPMWTNMPPANQVRTHPIAAYHRVRVERRGVKKYYHRADLDAYLAFREKEALRLQVLRTHKPKKICTHCGEAWPCPTYRKARR